MRYRFKTAFCPVAIGFFLIGVIVIVAGDYALSCLEFALSGEDSSGLVRYQIWATALSVIGLAPLRRGGVCSHSRLEFAFRYELYAGFGRLQCP